MRLQRLKTRGLYGVTIGVLALLVTVSVACSRADGRVTKAHYEQLEFDMSYAEIVDIMGREGEPYDWDEIPDNQTAYKWENPDDSYITVTLVDGKLGAMVESGL